MRRFTVTSLMLAASLLACVGVPSGPASAQQAATGQFGQRVGSSYLPSTNDAGCVGLICNPLPASRSNPAEAAPLPSCEGLLCSLTPYSMQRPYTASEAAAVERQRAGAQAQAALPSEPATPTRHARKHKAKAMKAAARTPAPAEAAQ